MNKKGASVVFNAIVLAAIALIVLVVLWMIYTGHIGKASKGIGAVGESAGGEANDVSWCLGTTVQGKSCDKADGDTCTAATLPDDKKECKLVCPTGKIQKIDQTNNDKKFECSSQKAGGQVTYTLTDPATRYVCCD